MLRYSRRSRRGHDAEEVNLCASPLFSRLGDEPPSGFETVNEGLLPDEHSPAGAPDDEALSLQNVESLPHGLRGGSKPLHELSFGRQLGTGW
ncbi:MAG: hypothetical protein QOD49_3130 [Actinomycetota bacterium]|nr:hypothetical protein [Actinomycetota bacterium]